MNDTGDVLVGDDATKVLKMWSREVVLFFVDRGPYRCECGADHQVTVGRDDRVRCPGCNQVLMIER